MALVRENLKFYKALVNNDTATNGGLPSNNVVVSAISENIFPTISQPERVAGSTKYRKLFAKPASDAQDTLYNSRIYLENPTPSDDAIYIIPAGIADVQSVLTGSERLYGCGWLNAGVSSGATSIDVRVEIAANQVFVNGDLIRISDKVNIDDAANSEEYRTLTSVTWVGNVATLGFTPGLDNVYSATGDATRVASLFVAGDVKSTFSNFVVTSVGGNYDEVSQPVLLNNLGCVKDTWTFQFTSSSAFSITGAIAGNVGSGNITTGAAPLNPANSKIYFNLESAGFSGGFVAGDTIVFQTHPPVSGIWLKREVPINTPSFTGNSFVLVIDGEAD